MCQEREREERRLRDGSRGPQLDDRADAAFPDVVERLGDGLRPLRVPVPQRGGEGLCRRLRLLAGGGRADGLRHTG